MFIRKTYIGLQIDDKTLVKIHELDNDDYIIEYSNGKLEKINRKEFMTLIANYSYYK